MHKVKHICDNKQLSHAPALDCIHFSLLMEEFSGLRTDEAATGR